MNSQTVYRCTGSCHGATFEAGKSCGAESCELHNVPLKPYTQCEGCAAQSAGDGKAHGCAQCSAL